VQDHPYQPAHLDTWTLLTHIAARTERVTVFPNVANLPLRPPVVLEDGISGFVLMADTGDRRDLHRFAEEVAPAVRELVERERTVPAPGPDAPVEVSGPGAGSVSGGSGDGSGDGDHLVAIHDHLRQELAQVHDLVGQVARGLVDVGAARSMINTMTMRQNSWTLGTYCESYCRVVTTHHTIEDLDMFPRLVRADPSLAPVVDRLQREHHEVAAVLEDVDRALVELVGAPDAGPGRLQRAMGTLSDVLLEHLAYEESQLVGPLNTMGIGGI
jgi:hemerythrin-like domain-containing protein